MDLKHLLSDVATQPTAVSTQRVGVFDRFQVIPEAAPDVRPQIIQALLSNGNAPYHLSQSELSTLEYWIEDAIIQGTDDTLQLIILLLAQTEVLPLNVP
jgi:hypothetical protein